MCSKFANTPPGRLVSWLYARRLMRQRKGVWQVLVNHKSRTYHSETPSSCNFGDRCHGHHSESLIQREHSFPAFPAFFSWKCSFRTRTWENFGTYNWWICTKSANKAPGRLVSWLYARSLLRQRKGVRQVNHSSRIDHSETPSFCNFGDRCHGHHSESLIQGEHSFPAFVVRLSFSLTYPCCNHSTSWSGILSFQTEIDKAPIIVMKYIGKIWKMTPLLCACVVVTTLETQKCRKKHLASHLASLSLTFQRFNTGNMVVAEWKKKGKPTKRCLRYFDFCPRTHTTRNKKGRKRRIIDSEEVQVGWIVSDQASLQTKTEKMSEEKCLSKEERKVWGEEQDVHDTAVSSRVQCTTARRIGAFCLSYTQPDGLSFLWVSA